jgi:4'-phosphopantetheinyl transferase
MEGPSCIAGSGAWLRDAPPETLRDGEIHVWSVRLGRDAALAARLLPSLSTEEQARAQRFHFERDRRTYVLAHGTLRLILARYLQTTPKDLRFHPGPHGKPYLDESLNRPALGFNFSRSAGLLLGAVVRGREIGIDVERVAPLPDVDRLVSRFFTPGEQQYLNVLPPPARLRAFFHAWTRKEAFLKATGAGLSAGLDGLTVPLTPCTPGVWLPLDPEPRRPADWHVCELAVGRAYIAALAVQGRDWNLTRRP